MGGKLSQFFGSRGDGSDHQQFAELDVALLARHLACPPGRPGVPSSRCPGDGRKRDQGRCAPHHGVSIVGLVCPASSGNDHGMVSDPCYAQERGSTGPRPFPQPNLAAVRAHRRAVAHRHGRRLRRTVRSGRRGHRPAARRGFGAVPIDDGVGGRRHRRLEPGHLGGVPDADPSPRRSPPGGSTRPRPSTTPFDGQLGVPAAFPVANLTELFLVLADTPTSRSEFAAEMLPAWVAAVVVTAVVVVIWRHRDWRQPGHRGDAERLTLRPGFGLVGLIAVLVLCWYCPIRPFRSS